MKIYIRQSAIRDLKRIPPNIRKRIHEKIRQLENFPDVKNCKKLTNLEPAYRLRIGDYRVLFDVIGNEIFLGRVLHRKDSYKRKS